MKKLFIIAALLALTGCGSIVDQNGNPMSEADQFYCDQKCGLYDPRMSIISGAMCLNACQASKGYRYQSK